jgi:hypothetical protein
MWRNICFALLLICCFACTCAGQTADDTGLWFAALGNGKLDSLGEESRLRWWFDAHYRLLDDTNGFNQSIVRPGLGYALTDKQTVWAGYGWINTSPIVGEDFDEHRIWQQWTASPSVGCWKFLHRSRFEQRLVETGDDVGLRWRQFFRGQRVINHCPEWSLVLWDEAFFNLNDTDWGAQSGFDQNRSFIGFGYKPTRDSKVRTEIGYLNQFIDRESGADGLNHILSVNFFF